MVIPVVQLPVVLGVLLVERLHAVEALVLLAVVNNVRLPVLEAPMLHGVVLVVPLGHLLIYAPKYEVGLSLELLVVCVLVNPVVQLSVVLGEPLHSLVKPSVSVSLW